MGESSSCEWGAELVPRGPCTLLAGRPSCSQRRCESWASLATHTRRDSSREGRSTKGPEDVPKVHITHLVIVGHTRGARGAWELEDPRCFLVRENTC